MLRANVVVDRALRNAGGAADIAHGGVVKALLDEDADRWRYGMPVATYAVLDLVPVRIAASPDKKADADQSETDEITCSGWMARSPW